MSKNVDGEKATLYSKCSRGNEDFHFSFNFNLKTSCRPFSPSMLTKERERLETPFKRRSDSPNTNKHLNPLNRAETGTPIALLI